MPQRRSCARSCASTRRWRRSCGRSTTDHLLHPDENPDMDEERLARLVERLEAHLDGLRVAGEDGRRSPRSAMRNIRKPASYSCCACWSRGRSELTVAELDLEKVRAYLEAAQSGVQPSAPLSRQVCSSVSCQPSGVSRKKPSSSIAQSTESCVDELDKGAGFASAFGPNSNEIFSIEAKQRGTLGFWARRSADVADAAVQGRQVQRTVIILETRPNPFFTVPLDFGRRVICADHGHTALVKAVDEACTAVDLHRMECAPARLNYLSERANKVLVVSNRKGGIEVGVLFRIGVCGRAGSIDVITERLPLAPWRRGGWRLGLVPVPTVRHFVRSTRLSPRREICTACRSVLH